MGFWSSLGQGLGAAASLVAAPFTGGASLAYLPAATALGGALGGMGDASEESDKQDAALKAQSSHGLAYHPMKAELAPPSYNLATTVPQAQSVGSAMAPEEDIADELLKRYGLNNRGGVA